MERLTKRITENQIELSAKANKPQHYSPIIHIKHPFWTAFDKLAEYEDAEEDGALIRLPCKVGTQVWKIKECSGGGRIPNWHEIYNVNFALELLSDFGKTVFLTKAEAEQALAKMKGEEE